MPIEIQMPRLSDSMTEGKLLRWCVAVGQAVREGDAIAEIEADKANMEIEALADGILTDAIARPGETVPVDATLGFITESAGLPAREAEGRQPSHAKADGSADGSAASLRVSPLAARLMAANGIDPQSVAGTGPGGAITPEDVERKISGKSA
jgi:pyruvate dehydrogenase E2 component (dihydrolipoamide acetyltransferase)